MSKWEGFLVLFGFCLGMVVGAVTAMLEDYRKHHRSK